MSDGLHYLGKLAVAPGAKRAVSIDLDDYIGSDTVSGTPSWAGATGLTVSGAAIAANVASCYVIAAQTGVDYNLECVVTLASTATERFLIILQCRTGATDPRLER